MPHYFIWGEGRRESKGRDQDTAASFRPGDPERLFQDIKVKFHESMRCRKAKSTSECAEGVFVRQHRDSENRLACEGLGPCPRCKSGRAHSHSKPTFSPCKTGLLLPTPHPGGFVLQNMKGNARLALGKSSAIVSWFCCDHPVREVPALPPPHCVWAFAPLCEGGEQHPSL